MYTTTEKLLLAQAISHFTLQDPSSITYYLKQRSLEIDTNLWPTVYEELLVQMHNAGYTDIVSYCIDKRYEKLVEKMNETLLMRDLILENKLDPQVYLNSLKCSKLQTQSISKLEMNKYLGTYTKQRPVVQPPVKVPFLKPQVKDRVVERVVTDTEIDVHVDIYNKHNRMYYLKMTQQERDFDDYLDTLDDKYYQENIVRKKNDLVTFFPASGKVKSTQEREDLIRSEYKVNRHLSPVSSRKVSIIDHEYLNVADKVCGRKNAEKEKSAWPADMKTLLKSVKAFVDKNRDVLGEDKRIENVLGQVSKQCSLSGTVLSVLVVLQDLFFKCKNKSMENILYEHKKVFIAFFDYYRK